MTLAPLSRRLRSLAACALAALVPALSHAQTVWTGASSTDWFSAGNWANLPGNTAFTFSIAGFVPNAALANGGTALISAAGASANSIDLGNGSGTSGTLTLNGSGATLVANSHINVGGNAGTGTFNLLQGTFTTAQPIIGNHAGSTGTMLVSGSSAVLHSTGSAYVGLNNGSTGTLTLAHGGTANLGSPAGTGVLQLNANGGGTATVNFGAAAGFPAAASGILNAASIDSAAGSGSATVQFNTTGTSAAPFYLTRNGAADGTAVAITGATSVVNTGGYTLLKSSQSYSGTTTVNGGTLAFSGSGSVYAKGTAVGSLVVNSGGTLSLQRNDLFGGAFATPVATLTINAGGLVTNEGAGWFNTLGGLVLNGGELRAGAGFAATFPAYQIRGPVTVGGSSASQITTTGGTFSSIQLGTNTAGGTTTFQVADATGDASADLTISAVLQNGVNNGGAAVASGLLKTGSGTLVLSAANTYTGGTTVSAGTVALGASHALADTSPLTVNGGTFDLGAQSDTLGAVTLISGSITGTSGALTGSSYAVQSGTISAALAGGAALTKTTSGTVTLTGTNTYTGGTTLSAGTLVGNSNSLQGNIANHSALVIDQSFDGSLGATITTGAGSLTKQGSGAVTLLTSSFHTGGTLVSAGTLTLGAHHVLYDTSALTIDGGTLALGIFQDTVAAVTLRSGAITGTTGILSSSSYAVESGTISAILGGSGALTKTTSGTVTLSGANTYTGATNVNGGTLALGASDVLPGIPTLNLNGGTLDLGAHSDSVGPVTLASGSITGTGVLTGASYAVQSGTISTGLGGGGSLTKTTAGTVTLAGANTFTGPTTITGGTLLLAHSLALQHSTVTPPLTGSLSFGTLEAATFGGLAGNTNIDLRNASTAPVALSVGAGNANSFYSGLLVGTGSLTKIGTGTVTFTAGHSFSGTTTINAGTLALQDFGSLYSGGTAAGAIVVNDGGTLRFQRNDTFGNVVAAPLATVTINPGGLVTSAGGFTTLNHLALAGGELRAGAGFSATFPAFQLKGTVTVSGSSASQITTTGASHSGIQIGNNAFGTFTTFNLADVTGDANADLTISAVLQDGVNSGGAAVGSGFVKTGPGTLALTGTNTFSHHLTINAGTVELGSSGTVLSDVLRINLNSGTLKLGAANEAVGSLLGAGTVNLFNGAGRTLTVGADNTSFSFGGVLQGGGGALTKTGTGTFTLTGENTFTGPTTIGAGALQLGDGGTSGVVAGEIINHASLFFNRSDALTFAPAITGTGSVTQQGTGTLTFTGTMSYAGGTTVSAGTLALGASHLLPDTGALTVNGGSFALGAFSDTVGPVTLQSGTITGSTGVLTGSSYAVQSGSISARLDGSAGLTKTTAGSVTLTGANTYSGGTLISAGTLVGDTGSLQGSVVNHGVLVVNQSFNGTLGVSLTGIGSLEKRGAGSVTLSGPQSHGGGTGVYEGTLVLGSSHVFLDNSAVSLGGGTLDLGAFSETVGGLTLASGTITGTTGVLTAFAYDVRSGTISGRLGGSGALTKTTAGTVTLSGANTYSGDTVINAGTLALGAHNVFAPTNTLRVNGGTLDLGSFNATSGSVVLAGGSIAGTTGVLSGSAYSVESGAISAILGGPAALAKSTAGTVILSGASTYTGGTTVAGGTLALGANHVLVDTGALLVNGGTFDLGAFSETVGTVTLHSGGIAGTTGVLSGSAYDVQSGTVSGRLGGPAALTKSTTGTVTLSGANAYTGGTTVDSGWLVLGANHVLADTGALTVNAAVFDIAGFSDTVGHVTLQLGGITGTTGVLTGASYQVQSGVITAILGGSGALTKSGSGGLTLSGANLFTGGTTVSGGTITLGHASALGPSGAVVVGSGATIDAATHGFDLTRLSGAGTVTGSGVFSYNSSASQSLGTTLGGSASLTKAGTGTFTIVGANTYSGPTTINSGTLAVSGSGSLYSGGTAAGSLAVNSGGTLLFQRNDTFGGAFSTPAATVTINAGGLVTNDAGWFTTLNNLTLNGGELRANAGFSASFPAFQLKHTVTAGGSVPSQITTTGATHAGIQIGNNTAGSATTFHVPDVTGSAAADLTISAVLQNTLGAGNLPVASSLIKTGTGTLALNAANTYAGGTTISFGTVTTGHTSALGTGPVAVSGATAILALNGTALANPVTLTNGGTLSGSGGIGALSISSGGTIFPGNSPGLTTAGTTTFGPGGTYVWEINNAASPATSAGTRYDLLSIAGALNITATSGNPFTIHLTSLLANNTAGDVINFNSSVNSNYTIASASSGITGFSPSAFTLNTTGFSNALNGGTWSLGTSGHDLNLTFTASAIPEPGTYAALFGVSSLALALYCRRRK